MAGININLKGVSMGGPQGPRGPQGEQGPQGERGERGEIRESHSNTKTFRRSN